MKNCPKDNYSYGSWTVLVVLFCETFTAIYRLVVSRFKRNFVNLTARCTNYLIHLLVLTHTVLSCLTTFLTTLRFLKMPRIPLHRNSRSALLRHPASEDAILLLLQCERPDQFQSHENDPESPTGRNCGLS